MKITKAPSKQEFRKIEIIIETQEELSNIVSELYYLREGASYTTRVLAETLKNMNYQNCLDKEKRKRRKKR